ncbi:hypothetical protein TeGR_g14487 [Tetraparma gracilis]|uniref:Large ribosomal subunit protein eL22 n=1 Tax=Tetraparma gracilis TaxID=2962635 RepID=A0ABQ6MIV6_9STRA|nr:hypothetical protein TeGR_g14487 [Tetraparma gracilis]
MAPAKSSSKKVAKKVIVDCTAPVNDKVIDLATFEKFLHDKIKVNGKCPAPAGAVEISRDKTKAHVVITFKEASSSKRYIKYLTKKYLKKQQLKDYLRVVMGNKNSYELRYYKFDADKDAAEDEE